MSTGQSAFEIYWPLGQVMKKIPLILIDLYKLLQSFLMDLQVYSLAGTLFSWIFMGNTAHQERRKKPFRISNSCNFSFDELYYAKISTPDLHSTQNFINFDHSSNSRGQTGQIFLVHLSLTLVYEQALKL